MFRKLIAKILKLETRETVFQMAKELAESRLLETHLKEHVKQLQEEIALLKGNEINLKERIVFLEGSETSEGGLSQTEILIEETHNTAEEPFLPQEMPNIMFTPVKSPSVKIGYGQKYTPKESIPSPKPIVPLIPIKATETVSFITKEKIYEGKKLNPKVQAIIDKLAKIHIKVRYSNDQYLLISKNGDFPLQERFTTLDVYGELVLLLTDVKSEHAAYSLQTGKIIEKSSKDKNIVIAYIEEYLSTTEYKYLQD